MTTFISPRATADRLVADYMAQAKDPLATDETSDGIMVMNTDIQVSESAYHPLSPEQLAEGDMTQERT